MFKNKCDTTNYKKYLITCIYFFGYTILPGLIYAIHTDVATNNAI